MKQTLVELHTLRSSERGGARLKLLIVIVILGAIGYAGYLFVPVKYHEYLFKDLMDRDVDVATTQADPVAWLKGQLTRNAPDYNVPADAVITTSRENSQVVVRVQFTRAIELPGYTYQYEFDHTAKSTTFLNK